MMCTCFVLSMCIFIISVKFIVFIFSFAYLVLAEHLQLKVEESPLGNQVLELMNKQVKMSSVGHFSMLR